jgi:UDP-N-acetylglucosamine 3-dehydrogenase
MSKEIEGVIVGFGNMGQTHLERYRALGIYTSVVETDNEKVRIAESQGVSVYLSLDRIPDPNQFHFLDICTPTYLHLQHIQEAMRLGKPIAVEKPIVRTIEEVKKLRELSSNYPAPIFVAEVEQYNPKLADFLAYSGTPIAIQINREVNLDFFLKGAKPWFLDENLSGGIVLDLMIHDINLLIAKYGKPTQVGQVEWSQTKYSCPDDVKAKLTFGGFDVGIHASWISEDQNHPIKTSIEVREQYRNILRFDCNDYHIRSRTNAEDAFYREIQAFLESVTTGTTPYPLSLYLDGIEVALDIFSKIKGTK